MARPPSSFHLGRVAVSSDVQLQNVLTVYLNDADRKDYQRRPQGKTLQPIKQCNVHSHSLHIAVA